MVSGPETAIVAGVETAGGDVWWTEAKVCPEGKCISIDFSKKTDGMVGILEATPVTAGILFPDGNTWTKNTWTEESGAANYVGKYADEHHADGWRTIAVSGSEEAIVAGVDEKGGPAWSTKGMKGYRAYFIVSVSTLRISARTLFYVDKFSTLGLPVG
jgi:hypothetical protein